MERSIYPLIFFPFQSPPTSLVLLSLSFADVEGLPGRQEEMEENMEKSCEHASREELKRIVLKQREIMQRLLQAAACLADGKVCIDCGLASCAIASPKCSYMLEQLCCCNEN